MANWWRKLLGIRPARPGETGQAAAWARAYKNLRARYDAAQWTDDNRRHWAHADHLSSRAANRPEVRRILRNRARYEVANNCYARGMLLTLANDVVGSGPRLQIMTPNEEANHQVERAFAAWGRAVNLPEKLRTMRLAKAQDGEAFALLTTNRQIPHPVQLDVRLLEADLVSAPFFNAEMVQFADGIIFDDAGNPVEYHVLKHHPGDFLQTIFTLEFDRYPARMVLHWFRPDRPGQVRGIPEITPALPLFAMLRRFTLATLAAAETAADFAAILETDAPAWVQEEMDDPDSLRPNGFEGIEIEPRMMTPLPAGWKANQLRPEHPSTTHQMFVRVIISEAARCINMPYNIAAGDSSGYNYSSGRLDHQTYYRDISVQRAQAEQTILSPILLAFLDEASLIPGLIPAGLPPFASWPFQWFWDGPEHQDPAKEANGQATRLQSATTTLAWEYARQGRDWKDELRQRARELEMMRELGIPSLAAAAGGGAPDDPAGETENEEVSNAP